MNSTRPDDDPRYSAPKVTPSVEKPENPKKFKKKQPPPVPDRKSSASAETMRGHGDMRPIPSVRGGHTAPSQKSSVSKKGKVNGKTSDEDFQTGKAPLVVQSKSHLSGRLTKPALKVQLSDDADDFQKPLYRQKRGLPSHKNRMSAVGPLVRTTEKLLQDFTSPYRSSSSSTSSSSFDSSVSPPLKRTTDYPKPGSAVKLDHFPASKVDVKKPQAEPRLNGATKEDRSISRASNPKSATKKARPISPVSNPKSATEDRHGTKKSQSQSSLKTKRESETGFRRPSPDRMKETTFRVPSPNGIKAVFRAPSPPRHGTESVVDLVRGVGIDLEKILGEEVEKKEEKAPQSPTVTPCPHCDEPLRLPLLPVLNAALPTYPSHRFCRLHRAELTVIPEGEKRGWPFTMDCDQVRQRVQRMHSELVAVVEGRVRSVYREIAMEAYREMGRNRARSAMGVMTRFQITLPGYYGPKGTRAILAALNTMFVMTRYLTPRKTAPQDPAEYMQQVLVPEVAVRLIRDDLRDQASRKGKRQRKWRHEEEEMEVARGVMEDSVEFGVCVHGDEDEDSDSDSDSDEDKIKREK